MRDRFDQLSDEELFCSVCGDTGLTGRSPQLDPIFCSCSVGRTKMKEELERDRRAHHASTFDVNWNAEKRRQLLGTATAEAEVDVAGMDFDAVRRVIEALPPGGATLERRGDRTFVVGGDVEFAVWAAVKQGYVRRRIV